MRTALGQTRRRALVAVAACLLTAACSAPADPSSGSPPVAVPSATQALPDGVGPLSEIPADARVSNGGPDPRTAAYWVGWSTCGEGSQAAVASANGGRAAGWVILDDLLADPGIRLGDHALASCDEALAVLGSSDDPVSQLAGAVLTAELDLSAGTESCQAIEAVVRVGHLVLQAAEYRGPGAYDAASAGGDAAVTETTELLDTYLAGDLCR